MAGLEVIGREYYGVFPLRGKFLNVRDAPMQTVMKNNEVNSLIKIIGLQIGNKYSTPEEFKTLRYGRIMIMADQDHDGSHIKGLVINFIQHYWPNLFRKNGFLVEFVTPIVKIFKKTNERHVIPFFTLNDFQKFVDENELLMKTFRIKYYKGLGTSDNAEAQEYFEKLQQHKIEFFYTDNVDDEKIVLAFDKKKADERKDWLTLYDPKVYVDHSVNRLSYKDFVDKELMAFSIANNERAIPNLMDGLKTG